MIPCTEFIPAYSQLFRTLEALGGKQAVHDYWRYLSDEFLNNPRNHVREHGIRGCWIYWSHTLNEEAAGFEMELDEEAGEFTITMEACPSKGMLLSFDHVEPYHDYRAHCDTLYRRVPEPLGYEYAIDMSRCEKAMCAIKVRRGIEGL